MHLNFIKIILIIIFVLFFYWFISKEIVHDDLDIEDYKLEEEK